MDQFRLPFVRLYDFWRKEPTAYRVLWALATGMTIVLAIMLLVALLAPGAWAIAINEVSSATNHWIPLWKIEQTFRSVTIDFPVFRQSLTYTASPISPDAFPVWAFMIAQCLGWSLILTTTARLQGMWTYLFMLGYALFLHFSGMAAQLGGEGIAGYGVEFVWIIGALVFAYAHQVEWLNLKLPLIWGISFLWTLLPFLIVANTDSWFALHESFAATYPFLLVILILFTMFAGKEPVNLMVYLLTNRRQPAQRFDSRLVITSLVVLLILELIWLLDALEVIDPGSLAFRPGYLFVIAALILPATSLNLFGQVRKIFPRSAFLSLILLGWVMVVLSFVFMNLTVLDPIFNLVFERLIAVLFFGVGAGYTLFLISNHLPLFQRKVHLYYLMGKGRRMSLAVVWLIGLIALVVAEGYQGWRGIRLFAHVSANHDGDQDLLRGNDQEATAHYTSALKNSPVSPKSNYNLASISVKDPEQLIQTIRYYETATSELDFGYARINGSLLLDVSGLRPEAIALLQEREEASEVDAELLNNLGTYFRAEGESDSAIVAFQKSLLIDPDLAPAALNLAEVYRENNLSSEAFDFYQIAMESREVSAPVLAAGIEYQLATGQILDLAGHPEIQDPLLTYHRILLDWKNGQQPDWDQVASLAEGQSEQGIVMLDVLRQFSLDSVDYAISRAEFMDENFPAYSGGIWMVLGAAYLDRDVPEMAEYCFRKASEANEPKGQYLEGLLLLDQGKYDSALVRLSEVRVRDEFLWDDASKERAMLLLANGQDVFAGIEYDLTSLTFNDWMRVADYADSTQFYIPALNAYRKAQQADSSSAAPYIELSLLYASYGDSLAFANLDAGRQLLDPVPPALHKAEAEVEWMFGNLNKASKMLYSLPDSIVQADPGLEAKIQLALGDTIKALQLYTDMYAANILNTEAINGLIDIAFDQGNVSEANELITTALQYNRQNPELWYRYALISREWGFGEDAGFGATKAIELSNDPDFREKIAKDFTEEIRSLVK